MIIEICHLNQNENNNNNNDDVFLNVMLYFSFILLLFVEYFCSSIYSIIIGIDSEYVYSHFIGYNNISQDSILWNNTIVTNYDDSPFQLINLPFTFPFFNSNYNSISISPNGALHINPIPPCGIYFQGACSNNFITCCLNPDYNMLLAACLTDLNPSDSSSGSIKYSLTYNKLIVWYNNIRLYVSPDLSQSIQQYAKSFIYNFFIQINSNGIIEYNYIKIYDPSNIPGWDSFNNANRKWLVTLRTIPGQSKATANKQDWIESGELSGSVFNGIYPKRSEVISNSSLRFYPFSSRLCYSPAKISLVPSHTNYGLLK